LFECAEEDEDERAKDGRLLTFGLLRYEYCAGLNDRLAILGNDDRRWARETLEGMTVGLALKPSSKSDDLCRLSTRLVDGGLAAKVLRMFCGCLWWFYKRIWKQQVVHKERKHSKTKSGARNLKRIFKITAASSSHRWVFPLRPALLGITSPK
jgi:hypothetical protein